MASLIAAFLAFGISLICLALSGQFRAVPRLRLLRFGIYLGLPSLSAILVLLPLQFDVSFADAMSLVGLCVSLAVGVSAKALDLIQMRIRVGIVIPSRAPFHTELRRGLAAGMLSARTVVHDDYMANHRAVENLATFVTCLRNTLDTKPDYLVIACPSFEVLGNDEIMTGLRIFQRRGGQLIFIDNAPSADIASQLRRFGLVRADVERVAELICEWIVGRVPEACIFVVSGPKTSDPALRYKRILESRFPTENFAIIDTHGWSEAAAQLAVEGLRNSGVPDFIVCGNDVMAFGAVRAIRANAVANEKWNQCRVVGYNGISRALFAIAERDNPFVATVCIPPSTYGREIAAMILRDSRRWKAGTTVHEVCIPFSEGQLVDSTNVDLMFED